MIFSKNPKISRGIPALFVLIIFITFTQNIPNTSGANILFFTSAFSSYSHRNGLEPLAIKLADRGHNVTMFTPIKSRALPSQRQKHPNLTETCTKETVEINREFLKELGVRGLKTRANSKYTADMEDGTWMFDLVFKMSENAAKSREVHDLFQRSQFDMIILDKTSLGEVILAFAYKFNITKIIYYMGAAAPFPWEQDMHGLPSEVSWVPSWPTNYRTKQLSFWNRLQTEVWVLSWYFGYTLYYLPKLDKLLRAELQLEGMPPLEELARRESLVLLNGHYSDTFPRALPPFYVAVGGMHLQESNGTLPPDLERFLSLEVEDKQAEFIYLSLGSYFQSSNLPPKLVQTFLDAFKSLAPLKFMWKWDGEAPENTPTNVLLRKWFPQPDVLAHPKIRGFVTQGGQVSMQQGIFNGVPIIIFPVEGDQDYNAKRVRMAGNGIELELCDLTVEELREAIQKLLTDKTYSEAASKLSIASKHRPMHPLDLAAWWTEFVLSQDDVSYLKPQTKNVTWWVTRSLDVWAFIFGALIFLVFATLVFLYYSFKILVKICFKGRTPVEPHKKNM